MPKKRKSTDIEGLGYRLRRARMARGLTQAELAHSLGMTSSGRISSYESDKFTPTAAVLRDFANALNISADCLLFDDIPDAPLRSSGLVVAGQEHRPDRVGPPEIILSLAPEAAELLDGIHQAIERNTSALEAGAKD